MSSNTSERSILELLPHKGVGSVRFGMPSLHVEQLLGRPDSEETRISEDFTIFDNAPVCLSRSWVYDDPGLSLSFTAHDGSPFNLRLTGIEGHGPRIQLWGHKLIGLSESRLVSLIPSLPAEDLILHSDFRLLDDSDPELDQCEYYSAKANVSIWLERDRIVTITLWPAWLPNDFRPATSYAPRRRNDLIGAMWIRVRAPCPRTK